MPALSKLLKDAATRRETVTPDEHGMRVLSASLDRAKALMAEAADALDERNVTHVDKAAAWDAVTAKRPRWKPIAEAPRDVPLLVFWPDFAQFGFSIQITSIPADINLSEGSGDVRVPTHFMHLPTPPEGE